MSKTNSKPRTLEARNPLAQSTFGAQLTEATISGDRRIEPAKTLVLRALVFIIVLVAIVGGLATLIAGAM